MDKFKVVHSQTFSNFSSLIPWNIKITLWNSEEKWIWIQLQHCFDPIVVTFLKKIFVQFQEIYSHLSNKYAVAIMDNWNPSSGSCTEIWKIWWFYTKIVSSLMSWHCPPPKIQAKNVPTPKNDQEINYTVKLFQKTCLISTKLS